MPLRLRRLGLILGLLGLGGSVSGGTPTAELRRDAEADALGPASAPAYPHRAVRRQQVGSGARSYWLFEPADPTPARAPVVVFHHGWLATNPGVYGAWIEHLVRQG